MLGGIAVTDDLEEGKRPLNKDDSVQMNRGVELLLRNRRKVERPKTFQVKIGKLMAFWNREITLSLDIKKK